jgi:aldehyde dehydrogenase (NAD+)
MNVNATIPVSLRKTYLEKLLQAIIKNEEAILEAIYKDLKKPKWETYLSEIHYVISDLRYTIHNLESWSKPKKIRGSLLNFPSANAIHFEPYGKTLIIAPWNYPLQLAICPLIGAIAAGNSVVLKPSELSIHTSNLLSKIIQECFEVKHALVVLGGAEMTQTLLKQKWDYIFFTGSVAVGKIIAKAAAENLTPVTLELGGKNPCIVDETANLKVATKRIIWGKFFNAGQTCIAPDYLLVHKNVKATFMSLLAKEITNAYGENPFLSMDFARIISLKNWRRLEQLLHNQTCFTGGISNEAELYIAPTLVDEPTLDSELMKEEIFGPILPILSYESDKDLEKIITTFDKPLSLYVFSENKAFTNKILKKYSFGGGCINDVLVHYINKRMPFGGVGSSGIGHYHGKNTFNTFSHQKSVLIKPTWIDIPIRYAPYKNKLKKLKKILYWL